MATGGIFQLITNDGKQDRMLMASALLKQRIDDARKIRENRGDTDTTPTLYDIERTHILFTNAHFKPFAAIGYEYNKVAPQSGNVSLGSKIMFSIPQFGDFFNDMVVHVTMDQPVLSLYPPGGSTKIHNSQQNLFRWCNYPGERLLKNVKFEVNGNPLDEYTSEATNFHREFCVQPNKKIAWNRCVGQEENQVGWIDQPNWDCSDVPAAEINYRTQIVDNSGLQTPTGIKTGQVELFIPLLFWCNKDPRLAVPSVAIPYGQRFITLELASQSELVAEYPRGGKSGDPWSPANLAAGGLLSDVKNVRIELYINNIFVNPEVHNIFIKRIGFSLIRVHRMQITESQTTQESILLQNLKWPIEALFVGMRMRDYNDSSYYKKYLDRWNTFSRVTDTSRMTTGWTVYKDRYGELIEGELGTMAELLTTDNGDVPDTIVLSWDNGMPSKYTLTATYDSAAELLTDAPPSQLNDDMILQYNSGTDNITYYFAVGEPELDGTSDTVPAFTGPTGCTDFSGLPRWTYPLIYQGSTGVELTTGTLTQYPPQLGSLMGVTKVGTQTVENNASALEYTIPVYTPTLLTVSIKAHGIPIYNAFPSGFYNAYLPYAYGGANINAPTDIGALMITFCLYPGTYQPSGHINVSRAREFYIDYTSNLASASTSLTNPRAAERGTLIVLASAINFLLISDGSAVLRYST
jgi:hypothetical protein